MFNDVSSCAWFCVPVSSCAGESVIRGDLTSTACLPLLTPEPSDSPASACICISDMPSMFPAAGQTLHSCLCHPMCNTSPLYCIRDLLWFDATHQRTCKANVAYANHAIMLCLAGRLHKGVRLNSSLPGTADFSSSGCHWRPHQGGVLCALGGQQPGHQCIH